MILRACTVCGSLSDQPRCPKHRAARVPWAGSDRRERTVSGWEQQRRARQVIAAHGGICHLCGQPGATIADHVVALAEGGADSSENLRPAHPGCHARKTAEEAARGRARRAG